MDALFKVIDTLFQQNEKTKNLNNVIQYARKALINSPEHLQSNLHFIKNDESWFLLYKKN